MNDEEALKFFIENKKNHDIIRPYIGMKTMIHLSPERRIPVLEQIERARGQIGKITKVWPKFEERNKNTDESDALFNVINLGLRDESRLDDVLPLLAYLISIPSFRIFTQLLIEETNFLMHIPDDSPYNLLFSYYLSYKYKFDVGVLNYKDSVKEYNDTILKFQTQLGKYDPKNKLCIASISKLQSDAFVYETLLNETDENVMKNIMHDFAIPIDDDKEINAFSICNFLQAPIDPSTRIPQFVLPKRRGPPVALYPHFQRFALSHTDAMIQIFLQKRYKVADQIISYLESVCNELNPDKEIRFHPMAIPLVSPPLSSINPSFQNDFTSQIKTRNKSSNSSSVCCSLVLDTTFMQWDAKSFEIGEVIYILNINDSFNIPTFSKEQKKSDEMEVKCVGCVVLQIPKPNILIVEVCDSKIPSIYYDVVVKLPKNLSRDCQRLLQIPKLINLDEQIPRKVSDSLLGYSNSEGPGITLIDTPLGTSGCFAAANWLAENFNQNEKTLIIGNSSLVLDDFVSELYRIKPLLIPRMYLLRLDLSNKFCYEDALKSRDQRLQTLIQNGVDASYCQSCLVAINYLRQQNDPGLDMLAKQLEDLWPFEYLSDVNKCIDYLQKDVAKIIFQLTNQNVQFNGNMKNITNLIIIDSCQFEISDLVSTIAAVKPQNIRIYSPYKLNESLSLYGINETALSSLWPKDGEQNTFSIETSTEIRHKNDQICSFIKKHVPDAVFTKTFQTPCILNACHFFLTESPRHSLEVVIASSFFFRLFGFDKDKIFIVVPNEAKISAIDIMKQRAAWNSNLLMMKEQIVTIDEILQSNNEPDVICFDSSLVEDGCSTDVILLLAQAAKFSLFISGPYCKEEWGIDYGPLQVCFNERFGQFNPQNDRHYFEVENYIEFLQLVQHMQFEEYNKQNL